ncbi:MAG: hypothetical protein ACTSRP_02415 [Candidatus Helarchaeota archaeon]
MQTKKSKYYNKSSKQYGRQHNKQKIVQYLHVFKSVSLKKLNKISG